MRCHIKAQNLFRICLMLILAPSLAFAQSIQETQAPEADAIRTNIERALKDFNIPGMAVGVVYQNEVVLADGFGVRNLDTNAEVTGDTLFGIASNTKAFTTAALSMLVEDGKLAWTDKVVQHLPEFRLSDPNISNDLEIRDLVSHRSGLGLGAGDLTIWPESDKSADEVIAALAHVPIAYGLREQYAYNNLMFVVAGEVVARVSGTPWAEFIETELFGPLAMEHSRAGFSRIPDTNENFAVGHIEYENELSVFKLDYLEDFRGAGAIASSARDMVQWLKLQLNEGELENGQTLLAANQQHRMWQPHIPFGTSRSQFNKTRTQFAGYGMGWVVNDYFGYKRVGHSGGILGMLSQVTLIPEAELGIVVLTNQQAFGAITAVTNEILEHSLNLPDTDWHAEQLDNYRQSMADKTEFELPAPDIARAALPQRYYEGDYHDAWYGDVSISVENDLLKISFADTPALTGSLEHYSGDTFVVRWDEPLLEADAFIQFLVDYDNQVTGARMHAVADFTDFSFDFHNLQLKKHDQE